MSKRVLNVGLIGGGRGAFIVNPHQKAIHMDGTRRVVCGALHENPQIAMEEAANWPYPIKGYRSYDEMIAAESRKPLGERVDYVVIVTPNFVHFDPAMKCLKAGIPVFCEKPLTITAKQAEQLEAAVKKYKVPFGIAHTYVGHWSSWVARWIITSGKLGAVRWADAYYLQGWLATRLETSGQQQASWRTNPKMAGASCCGGDIGSHAYMQLRFVTGLEVTSVRGIVETFLKGRQLDDHFTTYCELSNGGKALVRASQICIGHKNDLGLEVNCEKGSLVWRQEDAERLTLLLPGEPDRVYWRGELKGQDSFLGKLPDWVGGECTIPSGHVEAFHDAYRRLHKSFEEDVRLYGAKKPFACDGSKYANVHDGVMHMRFIEAAVKSSKAGAKPVKMKVS
ncbi:MAG: Gfo/Idh/MocA family oxidoreductase [Planctomycetes bacterium]|nr:Gfo/Idh/MocA family oxidoreductase [Planctomycetota bacterium]